MKVWLNGEEVLSGDGDYELTELVARTEAYLRYRRAGGSATFTVMLEAED